jgi:uncharacterized protein (DUF2235 family)
VTNVYKLSKMLRSRGLDGVEQVGQYHEGIGTSGRKLTRYFDGATGYGLSHNIRTAYRMLCEVFQPGDELFLLGFSRGAFTARSLGGFIRNCGILRPDELHRVDEAFALYRRRDEASHPRAALATRFRADYSVETRIHFIGVFDTVGALGNPLLLNGGRLELSRNRFHDLKLSSTVDNAYHALAVDEHRSKYEAALWDEPTEAVPGQVVEQVWFAGSHSNVGGGHPPEPNGVETSDMALQWLADAARSCRLDLDVPDLHPDPFAPLYESRVSFYKLWRPYFRPVGASLVENPAARSQSLDPSVVTRYRATTSSLYRPPNLEDLKSASDTEVAAGGGS